MYKGCYFYSKGPAFWKKFLGQYSPARGGGANDDLNTQVEVQLRKDAPPPDSTSPPNSK